MALDRHFALYKRLSSNASEFKHWWRQASLAVAVSQRRVPLEGEAEADAGEAFVEAAVAVEVAAVDEGADVAGGWEVGGRKWEVFLRRSRNMGNTSGSEHG